MSASAARPSTSRSRMRSDCRRRKRASSTGAGSIWAFGGAELQQAVREFLGREHAVQIARIGGLQHPFGTLQDGFGKESAVREGRDQATQRGRRTGDAVESRGRILAQPFEEMQRLVGIGDGCQQRLDARRDAFGNAVAQARNIFARAGRITKFNGVQQMLHSGSGKRGPHTDYSFRGRRPLTPR